MSPKSFVHIQSNRNIFGYLRTREGQSCYQSNKFNSTYPKAGRFNAFFCQRDRKHYGRTMREAQMYDRWIIGVVLRMNNTASVLTFCLSHHQARDHDPWHTATAKVVPIFHTNVWTTHTTHCFGEVIIPWWNTCFRVWW